MPRPFVKAVALSGAVVASALFAFSANAVQTVTPMSAASGGTQIPSVLSKNVNQQVVFYGIYSDNTAGSESGLGLKVSYDATKLTNVQITEEYTKCRIATAQIQQDVPATSQVVMGWIDTAIRPNGVVTGADGSVGWPDAADLTTGGCLNPGGINTDTAAASSSGLKLFKFTATTPATSWADTVVTIDAGQNFSYANGASSGFTPKSFTVHYDAAVPTIALASTNPFVSRKTHSAAGTFDIPIDPAGALTGTTITVEPRQAGAGHQVVFAFTGAAPTSVTSVTATTQAAASVPIVSTTFTATEMIVTLGTVPNGSRVQVSAVGVNGASGPSATAVVGFLEGDVDNSRAVNAGDILAVRLQSGQAVTASNFRKDVTVSGGTLNAGDILAVRLKSGQNLQ